MISFLAVNLIGKLPKGAKFTLCGSNLFYINEDIVESYSVKKNSNAAQRNVDEILHENGNPLFLVPKATFLLSTLPSHKQRRDALVLLVLQRSTPLSLYLVEMSIVVRMPNYPIWTPNSLAENTIRLSIVNQR